jgi:hypothetical protein
MAGSETFRVTCPSCRGGNPTGSERCLWCGNPLAASTAPTPLTNTPQVQYPLLQYAPQEPEPVPPAAVRLWRSPALRSGLVVIGVLAVYAIGTWARSVPPASGKPPASVRQVVAQQVSSGALDVYFILVDEDLTMTSSDGEATLRIVDAGKELYRWQGAIKQTDFEWVSHTAQNLKRGAVIYSFGKIDFSSFSQQPAGRSVEVRVTFLTPEGRSLDGNDVVSLNSTP